MAPRIAARTQFATIPPACATIALANETASAVRNPVAPSARFAIKKIAINATANGRSRTFLHGVDCMCYGFRHIKVDGQYSMCRWGRKVTQSRTGLPTPQVHLPRVCTHSEARLVFLLDSQLEKSRPRIKNFLPI